MERKINKYLKINGKKNKLILVFLYFERADKYVPRAAKIDFLRY